MARFSLTTGESGISTTHQIDALLRSGKAQIEAFEADSEAAFLALD